LLCAATGFITTRISQGHIEAKQRAALQQALDEFHQQFGDIDAPDDVQLREIARRSRLADLRFDANPVGDVGRMVQSLHDPRGRIVGWFSWAGDRGFVAAMDRLWGLLALVGAALGICTFIAMHAAGHVLRSLNRSAEDVRKLTTQDPLTGLANQRVMLEQLGEALARRRSGVVVLALVDLDGFRARSTIRLDAPAAMRCSRASRSTSRPACHPARPWAASKKTNSRSSSRATILALKIC